MAVAIIFIVHMIESIFNYINIEEEWFYLLCKVSMLPFFITAFCCVADARDLRARKYLSAAYIFISLAELCLIIFRASQTLLFWKETA